MAPCSKWGGGIFLEADARIRVQSKAGRVVFWILADAVTRPSPARWTEEPGQERKKKDSGFSPTPTMAAGDRNKRARPPPAASEPRKRARATGNDNDTAHPISIDGLAWQEVPMPDRLEDVEGFMGMEEVDGVDVLRTGDGGLMYKVCLHPPSAAWEFTC